MIVSLLGVPHPTPGSRLLLLLSRSKVMGYTSHRCFPLPPLHIVYSCPLLPESLSPGSCVFWE